MTGFSFAPYNECYRPELATEADISTSVVGCAIADLAIPNTGSAVGTDPVTGELQCPYQPTTQWGCSDA